MVAKKWDSKKGGFVPIKEGDPAFVPPKDKDKPKDKPKPPVKPYSSYAPQPLPQSQSLTTGQSSAAPGSYNLPASSSGAAPQQTQDPLAMQQLDPNQLPQSYPLTTGAGVQTQQPFNPPQQADQSGMAVPLTASDIMDLNPAMLGVGMVGRKFGKISAKAAKKLMDKGLIRRIGNIDDIIKNKAQKGITMNLNEFRTTILNTKSKLIKYTGQPKMVTHASDEMLKLLKQQKLIDIKKSPLKKTFTRMDKYFSKHITAAKVKRLAFKTVSGQTGTAVILTWFALDNILNGQVFHMKALSSGVQDGTIDPKEARDIAKQQMERRDTTIGIVNILKWFPLTVPFVPLINVGIESIGAQTDLEFNKVMELTKEVPEGEEEEEVEETWEETYTRVMDAERGKDLAAEETKTIKFDQLRHEDMIRDDDERTYYEELQAKKDIDEKQKQEFWMAYLEKKRQISEEERAYWDNVYKKRQEEKPSTLGFGLL